MIFILYWNDMGDGYFLVIILFEIIVFPQCQAKHEFKASISFQAWQSICRWIKFQKIGIAAVLRFINRRTNTLFNSGCNHTADILTKLIHHYQCFWIEQHPTFLISLEIPTEMWRKIFLCTQFLLLPKSNIRVWTIRTALVSYSYP